jgi:hypothetical protein
MAHLNAQKMDDIALLKSIKHAIDSSSASASSSASVKAKKKTPKQKEKEVDKGKRVSASKQLIFSSISESLAAPIKKYDANAEAFLILRLGTFTILEKNKRINEYPLRYRVYSLKHAQLESASIIWIKNKDVTRDFVKPVIYVHSLDTFSISNSKEYIQTSLLSNSIHYSKRLKTLTHMTNKTYTDFQGSKDNDDDYVIEFGWAHTDVTTTRIGPEEDDDDDVKVRAAKIVPFVSNMAKYANVLIPERQIEFISENMFAAKDNEALFKNIIICFAFFVLFAQCSLPDIVIKGLTGNEIYSYPINPRNHTLIDKMVVIMTQVIQKDYRNLLKKTSKELKNNTINVIQKIRNEKKIIDSRLENARLVYAPHDKAYAAYAASATAAASISLHSPSWKPNAEKKAYMDYLNKLELVVEPMLISDRFQGESNNNNKSRKRTNKKPVLFNVPKTNVGHANVNVAAPAHMIKQIGVTMLKNDMNDSNNLVISPDLQTALGRIMNANVHFKNDSLFSMLYTVEQNDQVWNDVSQKVKIIGDQNPKILELLKNLPRGQLIDNVLIEFLAYDLKDLLGKYAYIRLSPTAFNHIEHIKRMKMDVASVKWILQNMLNFSAFVISPYKPDQRYALVYMLLSIMWAIECVATHQHTLPSISDELYNVAFTQMCSTNVYIIDTLLEKIKINTMDIAKAREGFERIRETRKKNIMDLYATFDADGRIIKNAVKMGLMNIDDMMGKVVKNNDDGYDHDGGDGNE